MAQLKVKQISDFVSAVTAVHNGAVGTDTTTAIAAAKSQAISQAVVNGDIAYDVKNAASTALVSAESKDVVRAATASTATATVASNLSTELVARADADTALDGKITTEKGRIDAILSASNANYDTFAEVVALINSIDTTNDAEFGGYVTSNNAALSTELVARADGDTAAISTASADATSKANAAQSAAIASAESKDVVRAATASTATATVASNLSTELVVRADADTALQSQINALAGVNSEEEIATYVTAASFATVNTFDLNGGHVAVFVNGLQIHEAVAAGDGWKSGDGQNFTVQSLGYVLEAGDHIIVTGKIV